MNISDFLNHWREAAGAERANKDSFLLDLRDALDSLAALGLAVAAGAGAGRSWSALR